MVRYLRKFLVQPSAQSRVKYKVKPGCSEFFLVESWKPPRMETAQPLWAICCDVWLSKCCILLTLIPSLKHFLYFSLCPLSFVVLLCITMKSFSLDNRLVGTGRLLPALPKPSHLQNDQVLFPQPLLVQQLHQPVTVFGVLCWSHCS